jgi:hypothetical protein
MLNEHDIKSQSIKIIEDLFGESVERVDYSAESIDNYKPDLIFYIGDRIFVMAAKARTASATLEQAARQIQAYVAALKKSHHRDAIPLLVLPYVGNECRGNLQAIQANWVDLCGNADIRAPGLRIHVVGNENIFKKRGRTENIFAPKSSRVTRILLEEPKIARSQSEISKLTDLTAGYVSRVVGRLLADGYIERLDSGKLRSTSPHLLLDAWRSAYDFQRHTIIAAHTATRSGPETINKVISVLKTPNYAVTGLAGAWLLSGHASFRFTTIYVDVLPNARELASGGIELVDRGANIWLVIPNDRFVLVNSQEKSGLNVASPLQIYLDLKSQPERSKAAAEDIRENFLKETLRG